MWTEVTASDWTVVDRWRTPRTHNGSCRAVPGSGADSVAIAGRWTLLDSWLDSHVSATPLGREVAVGTTSPTASWSELDTWWEAYTETGHATAVAIAERLERSNDAWARSAAPFDTDPLAADLTEDRYPRGPLQPTTEVEWSQWLRTLLSRSGALVADLFAVDVAGPPDAVVREERLPKDDGFRRADLLVRHAARGVSVEVKLDDTNYEKTAETAALVERHHDDRTWTHTLLLPARKEAALGAAVDVPIDDGRIRWDDPGTVNVVYWRDVTATLRSILCRGASPDDHWAANAYLFCAVTEQQLMNFQPKSTVDDLSDPESVVDELSPVRFVDALDEQLTYLRTVVET
jgi:hypothetical protein